MAIKPKHLLIAGGAFLGFMLLLKPIRAASNLVLMPKVGFPSFRGLARIILPLDTRVQNPTNGKLEFTFPHVQMLIDGMVIGTSNSLPNVVTLPANGEIDLAGWLLTNTGRRFELTIELGSAAFALPSLIQLATGAIESLPATLQTTTTVLLPGFPDGKLIKAVNRVEIPSPKALRNANR